MPELYEGQTAVVQTKLQEAELLLQSNQECLQAEKDPAKRGALLRLIAGQSGTVGAYKRQLAKCQAETDTARDGSIKVRLSDDERSRLDAKARDAGQSLAQYIRAQCGLA